MPPYFPKPPPSIARPENLFIYSPHTLHKSLKKYPKHLKSLKIETKAFGFGPFQILRRSLLKRLQRRAKFLKALDFSKHEQFFKLKPHQALTLIKSFSHVQSLVLFGDLCRHFSHKYYLRWLTQSKSLSCLTFGTLSMHYEHWPNTNNPSILKSNQAKCEKLLKLPKLQSLCLKSYQSFGLNSSYPSPLKKLSISLKAFVSGFRLNLSHLKHLSILHLDILTFLRNILSVLASLPTPHKITHLTAFAADVIDPNDSRIFKISEFLSRFQSLHSIKLAIHNFLLVSTFLKSFKIPSSFQQLTLRIPIEKQKELIELADLIGTFTHLTLLALVNKAEIHGYASKGYRELFKKISGLSQLKSLELALNREGISPVNSEIFYGCLGEFALCVERSHKLQEIKFIQSEIGLAPEFDRLAEAFKKKGVGLKKLELKFFNGEKRIDHFKKLNSAFRTMTNLEKLSLENLSTEKESIIQFAEIMSELKWIRSLKLAGENPGLEKTDLVKTLKKILMKYGLEKLKWFGYRQIEETEELGRVDLIDIKEIILRNPRLYIVRLSLYGEKTSDLGFKNVKGFLP